MKVEVLHYPDEVDRKLCKQATLATIGKQHMKTMPDDEWLHKLMRAGHSPARLLHFTFQLTDVPYYVSVHLVRHHVGVNWFVQSQRNDRQSLYDRRNAPQGAPVMMVMDCNAEALINIAHKRLCAQADPATRELVNNICREAEEVFPPIKGLLVPMCEYNGGVCHEMKPCGKGRSEGE